MSQTCSTFSDNKCSCSPSTGAYEWSGDTETIVPSFLIYISWLVFVLYLNRQLDFSLISQVISQRYGENIRKFMFVPLMYLSILAVWEIVIPLLTYHLQPPHKTFSRYNYVLNSGLISVSVLMMPFYAIVKYYIFLQRPVHLSFNTDIVLHAIFLTFLLIMAFSVVGVQQLSISLPVQIRHIANEERAVRIISPEYTLYIWICLFLSILITWAFTKEKANYRSFFYRNKEINIMIRIFPYIWSTQFLHEFFCLFINYENLSFVSIWSKLSVEDNWHLLFNFLLLLAIWICSAIAIHQHYYMSVNPFSLTMSFIAFHNIIYYQRSTLIYNDFTWFLSTTAEVICGHFLILVAVWAVLHFSMMRTNQETKQKSAEEGEQHRTRAYTI